MKFLAVGDYSFQKKCLGKMGEVSKQGRTILFVSHNLQSIRTLCQSCILLQKGELIEVGSIGSVVSKYLDENIVNNYYRSEEKYSGGIKITEASLTEDNIHKTITLTIISDKRTKISIDVRISDQNFNPFGFGSLGSFSEENLVDVIEGENVVSFSFITTNFANGKYYLSIDLSYPKVQHYDRLIDCLYFEVQKTPLNKISQVFTQDWGYGCIEIPIINNK